MLKKIYVTALKNFFWFAYLHILWEILVFIFLRYDIKVTILCVSYIYLIAIYNKNNQQKKCLTFCGEVFLLSHEIMMHLHDLFAMIESTQPQRFSLSNINWPLLSTSPSGTLHQRKSLPTTAKAFSLYTFHQRHSLPLFSKTFPLSSIAELINKMDIFCILQRGPLKWKKRVVIVCVLWEFGPWCLYISFLFCSFFLNEEEKIFNVYNLYCLLFANSLSLAL